MSSNASSAPYKLTWWQAPLPPLYAKEPGGVILRITYRFWKAHNHNYNNTNVASYTEVKIYAQASEYFGGRKQAVQHRLCTLDFDGKITRETAESFVLPLLDIVAIRFELTVRRVDWWGERGKRKGAT